MAILKPLSDKIIIEILQAEEKTKSGIILPDSAQEKPQQAKVISVGPGKMLTDGKIEPMQVKVGDTIVFSKYSGSQIKWEDKEYLIIDQGDILATIG